MCFCVIGNISEKPAAPIFRVETYQTATWISHTGRWECAGHRMQDWSFGVRDHKQNKTSLQEMRENGKTRILQKLRVEPMLTCTLFSDSASSSEVSYVLNKM